MRALLTALTGLLLTAGLLTTPAYAESNGGVRIMPLGDSITDGFNVPGGYRINLWQRLVQAGHTADFVGSGFNGPASLGDHDHEGHSGWRIDQIDAQIVGWLQAYSPRTILLHIGTNDMGQQYQVSTAPARLSALIDKIRANAPQVELFVAQITPSADPSFNARIQTFNAAIPGIVASKGPLTHLVDQNTGFTTADLADGLHPNQTGYDKMAARWMTALQAHPASLVSTTVNLANGSSNRCMDVNGASQAQGAQIITWDCHTNPNQRWTPTAAGEYRIYNGTRCLDVNGNGAANGTKIQIWPCNGTPAQRFTHNANGSITAAGSGKCLHSTGTGNGALVELRDCNGTTAQRWTAR
ncbi:GDSL family lipase [Herbidospora galbida]|uniref:GDSL family lipase n=1 Tax=Herbidospora galbida TaxID=2575442 RepID=A0A4V5V1Q9_9ACTN|nr:ricin-type beta-trefoil lectin domain protein [Herbidospora galbida]TKK91023.1 GDSL family lipase [Herbidospora galbida]